MKRYFRSLLILFSLPGLLFLSSCKPDDDTPVAIHVRVESPLRNFLFFKEGSYWVYKSNDGLYDTVTVTKYKVDTLSFVDDKNRLISTQEYFWFTHYSSYLKKENELYRTTVAPTVTNVIVYSIPELQFNYGYLVQPAEINKEYCFVSSDHCLKITDKRDTTVNGQIKPLWIVSYEKVPPYNNQPVSVEYVGDIGITKRITEHENRTWELMDYSVIQ